MLLNKCKLLVVLTSYLKLMKTSWTEVTRGTGLHKSEEFVCILRREEVLCLSALAPAVMA